MQSESSMSSIKTFLFKAHGRISREAFTLTFTALSLVGVIVSPIIYMLSHMLFPTLISGLLIFLYGFYLLYATFVITIKRLHDLNLTGWISILLLLFPFSIPLIVYLVIQKGKPEDNKYGEVPLQYSGPPFLLKACYVIMILYAVFMLFILYYARKGSKAVRTLNNPNANTGQAVQDVIDSVPMPKKYKDKFEEELQKSPRIMGMLFIDNQFNGAGASIAKDKIMVVGNNVVQRIQTALSQNKKVEIRFPDNSSSNIISMVGSNNNPSDLKTTFKIDPPIGTPGGMSGEYEDEFEDK